MRRLLLAVAVAGAAAVSGCQPGASASFQAEGACTMDGRAPGIYPELEALLPGGLGEEGASSVDSGRSCSDERLSTLKAHGVTDLRFAGATWAQEGSPSSAVVALFRAPPGSPPLQADWMSEFYETGARASTKTENIEISRKTYAQAGEVYQLDTLNDLSFQSIAVWQGGDLVHVVIVATELRPGGATRADHERFLEVAVIAAANGRET